MRRSIHLLSAAIAVEKQDMLYAGPSGSSLTSHSYRYVDLLWQAMLNLDKHSAYAQLRILAPG